MSRPLRLEIPGGIYHVTSRGNRREAIYLNERDFEGFITLLGEICDKYNWRCHAFCLMTNHYHLVIETPVANLSRGMRQLNGVYTQRFNRSHGRVGHVFQGRYKSILVQAETYLLELARYVVLNPVRAQMVKTAGQWPWSSYRYMIGKETSASWLQTDYLLQQFSSSRTQAQQSYIRFIAEGKNQPSVWTHLRQQIYLGDENFVSRMQQRIDTASDLLEVPLAQKREVARPLCDYMEEFGDKHRAIQVAYGTGRYTLKEIADYIGCHYSTVSRIVNPKSQE